MTVFSKNILISCLSVVCFLILTVIASLIYQADHQDGKAPEAGRPLGHLTAIWSSLGSSQDRPVEFTQESSGADAGRAWLAEVRLKIQAEWQERGGWPKLEYANIKENIKNIINSSLKDIFMRS